MEKEIRNSNNQLIFAEELFLKISEGIIKKSGEKQQKISIEFDGLLIDNKLLNQFNGDFEASSIQSNEGQNLVKRLCSNKMQQSYCFPCYQKRIKKFVKRQKEVQYALNNLKEKMEKKLQQVKVLVNIKQKEEYLKLLKKQKENLKNNLEQFQNQVVDHYGKEASIKTNEKDKLKILLNSLQEETLINESELLSKRSQLRVLQAKKILLAYNLYKISHSYLDFSIASFLECNTIQDIVIAENDSENQSREKNICKINFKVQHFNEYTYEHRLIIHYSLQNLVKFIEYVVRVKQFEIPFPFSIDYHNVPQILVAQFETSSFDIQEMRAFIEFEEIELFDESTIPLYDNFIYCWINFFILYKRLGIDFKKYVLSKKLIFPVYQLKQFFEEELLQIPGQLQSIEYEKIIYDQQLIISDLLQINYHPKALKVISEEITFCRNDPNLQIIQISQLHDLQNHSKFSEQSEHDNSDFEKSFEFIDKQQEILY